jgi:chromosome segregation ATPase
MPDITQLDDLFEKAKEIESYVGQSQIILKSLITAKEDAGAIIRSLSQKQDELTHLQGDISGYLQTLQSLSQKAEAVLNPMGDQKKELDALSKKVDEGVSGIDGLIQQRLGEFSKKLESKLMDLTTMMDTAAATSKKNLDAGIADLVQKQDALAKNLTQRIEKEEKTSADTLKAATEQEKKETAELRKAIQDLKGLLDRFREDVQKVMAKQKEELDALADKRHQELSATVKELSDKHIKVLEKDSAQIKSTLNSVISKLGNVKFKKLLGL